MPPVQRPGQTRDPPGNVGVQQKVLTELAAGIQPMPGNNLT